MPNFIDTLSHYLTDGYPETNAFFINQGLIEQYPHLKKIFSEQEIADFFGKQKELTEDIILPSKFHIEASILSIRNLVDSSLSGDESIQKQLTFANYLYPKGLCGPITHLVFEYMHQILSIVKNNIGTQETQVIEYGSKSLYDFIEKGGIFRKFWGSYDKQSFQNGIQIGSTSLSCANDTFEIPQEQIVVLDEAFETGRFANIFSFEEIVRLYKGKKKEAFSSLKDYPQYFPLFSILATNHGANNFTETVPLSDTVHISVADKLNGFPETLKFLEASYKQDSTQILFTTYLEVKQLLESMKNNPNFNAPDMLRILGYS